MAERGRPQFGDKLPRRSSRQERPAEMFPDGDDLPIFSGTPQEVTVRPFEPQAHRFKQVLLPGMPAIDYDYILERDRQTRQRKRAGAPLPASGTLWQAGAQDEQQEDAAQGTDAGEGTGQSFAEVLSGYQLDTAQLRRLVAMGQDLNELLRRGTAPDEVLYLLQAITTLLRPGPKEQIRSPADAAGFLMLEMGHLDQEELRTVLLDTKNHMQGIVTVYRGSLNSAAVRVGEVYKEALRRNSAALIVAHNHPSSDPTPSPEDILVTRQIVEAGKLLDVECLDHLIIGQGRWVSMRERGLGFSI